MKAQRKHLIVGGLGLVLAASCPAQSRESADSQRSRALTLEQQGRIPDAEAAWEAIVKAHPADAEAYAHLGLLRARQERYTEAIAAYRKALTLEPGMPALRMNLGLAYFKSGDMRAAIATFKPLLDHVQSGSPEGTRIATLIGLAHYGKGDYADAIPYLKTAIAADPQNLQFRLYLTQSCLWSKQYQCVLDVYREILTLNPDSAEAHMLAGEAYDEMKDEAHAMEELEAAVKADPRAPGVHFGYGYLLWRMLRFDEAESQFRDELAVNPDDPLALTYLGDVQIRAGTPADAIPNLEHARKLQPSSALAHLDLGTAYQSEGRNGDALRELKEAEKLSPNDAKIHWQLGRFYQSLGRKVEARAELDKTRSLQEAADQSLVERLHPAQPSSTQETK